MNLLTIIKIGGAVVAVKTILQIMEDKANAHIAGEQYWRFDSPSISPSTSDIANSLLIANEIENEKARNARQTYRQWATDAPVRKQAAEKYVASLSPSEVSSLMDRPLPSNSEQRGRPNTPPIAPRSGPTTITGGKR